MHIIPEYRDWHTPAMMVTNGLEISEPRFAIHVLQSRGQKTRYLLLKRCLLFTLETLPIQLKEHT